MSTLAAIRYAPLTSSGDAEIRFGGGVIFSVGAHASSATDTLANALIIKRATPIVRPPCIEGNETTNGN